MTSDLLPCPFCGGRAEIWRAHPENPPRKAWIACMGRCAVLTKEHTSDAEAITAWNTRAKADQIMDVDYTADDAQAVLRVLLRHGEFGSTGEASQRNASVCAHEVLAVLTKGPTHD